jgi:hypothetical protein
MHLHSTAVFSWVQIRQEDDGMDESLRRFQMIGAMFDGGVGKLVGIIYGIFSTKGLYHGLGHVI